MNEFGGSAPYAVRFARKVPAMVMKATLAEIVDGRLVLPEDAIALLPPGIPLRVITNSERGTVCIFAKDPMTLSPQTEELIDALGALNEGLTREEYSAPFAEGALRNRKRHGDESAY